jgi:hypothetical protein
MAESRCSLGWALIISAHDYVLCNASRDFANKQAEKFRDSLAGLGAWGFVALLAAILEK